MDKAILFTPVRLNWKSAPNPHAHSGRLFEQGERSHLLPAAFHPFPAAQPLNRLGLAQWLVDTNNPLTARVIANRIWEQSVGRGIVETVEDFGVQGELPTHPELLDWLATDFMRQGWSMKAMHKGIVMSATYRQASQVTPDLYQRDPYNRLFARGPRVRLEAEMIRDQALAVSVARSKIWRSQCDAPQPRALAVVYNERNGKRAKGRTSTGRALYVLAADPSTPGHDHFMRRAVNSVASNAPEQYNPCRR